ncbi:siderophore-iron reductase FhuF [Tatumella saanichensis]|uniref:siderophore-iron reductase FhuF n=1 Tax=Tatumella saanichensis TaxID=480813 RepID=UPI0004A2423D|nr:siderophore-iron reductase FhuF [Tatumella saanichensis]
MQTLPGDYDLPRQVAAQRLLDPVFYDALLPAGLQNALPVQRLPWLSLWSHWIFAITLTDWAKRLCRERESLPLWDFSGQILLNDRGLPEQWLQRGTPCYLFSATQQWQHCQRLTDDFIRPLCHTLAELSGGNSRVFYSNAAVRLWAGMQQAELQQADCSAVQQLLTATHLRDAETNPLCAPYRPQPHTQPQQVIRRHCCLLYRLEGYEKCASCPLTHCRKKEC